MITRYIFLYVLCFIITSCVQCVISPIRLSELQELKKKIDAGALSAPQAQELFQKLTSSLSELDRKESAVTNILRAAERKNIPLSFDGKTIITQSLKAPGIKAPQEQPVSAAEQLRLATPLKEPTEPVRVVQEIPVKQIPVLQQPPIKGKQPSVEPPSGGTKPSQEIQEKPTLVVQEAPVKQIQVPQQLPSGGAKQPLTLPPGGSKKVADVEEPHKEPHKEAPLEHAYILTSAATRDEDIAFLKILGTEIEQMRAELKRKNGFLDPKVIKALVPRAKVILNDIISITGHYEGDREIGAVGAEAASAVIASLYATLQDSMALAAHHADDVLMRKLIRSYYHVIETFPIYSEKRLQKIEAAQLKKEFSAILLKLTTGDRYKKMDPDEVDKELAPIIEQQALLDEGENSVVERILDYQAIIFDHKAELETIDKLVAEGTALLAQTNPDPKKIHHILLRLIDAEDLCDSITKTQKEIGGQWLKPQVEKREKAITDINQKLEAFDERLRKEEERKEELEALLSSTKPFDKPAEHKQTTETGHLVTPVLKSKDLSESSAVKEIRTKDSKLLVDDLLDKPH